jgi:hypothetical protein
MHENHFEKHLPYGNQIRMAGAFYMDTLERYRLQIAV